MRFLCASLIILLVFFGASPAGSRDGGDTGVRHDPNVPAYVHPILQSWADEAPAGSRIWVRFTDHGSAAGRQVPITSRSEDRRLRRGVSLYTPERQPVAPEYISAVRAEGAQVHRVSRWLNAVSIAYDPEVTERLARLPMVASLQPVARSRRQPEEITATAWTRPAPGPVAAVLSYGGSQAQIEQINAHLAHQRGFTGAGVLVAMFDTGFRKDHDAFAQILSESRLVAEWDFVFDDGNTQNEPEDFSSAHNHGTSTWSVAGGAIPGTLYGPAYGASFLLAKTEDIRSETPVEEDNWMAAVEWADSIGADVISSSLSYDFQPVYDGLHAVSTQAADMAAELGIVVCNSAGNAGPGASTIAAPVDAFNILAIGSVTSSGTISSFSSRGPTDDGRIKPEVCARGSSTFLASASGVSVVGSGSGTSFSCPLVGGCAALVMEAHPDWNALMVREAFMQTASRASTPDNTFGWGIIDVNAAIDYGGSIVHNTVPYADTVLSYDSSLPVIVEAASLTAIDVDASAIYYREEGGSYVSVPFTPGTGDTLVAQLPSPATFVSPIEYYMVIRDSAGFTARAPESIEDAFTFVWQSLQPGDLDMDLLVTSSDVIGLVNYVFKSGDAPNPIELGEVNGQAPVNSGDIVYLVNYVFKQGPPPVLP